jgi:hypothetical protein
MRLISSEPLPLNPQKKSDAAQISSFFEKFSEKIAST